jgi:hypothetical protein
MKAISTAALAFHLTSTIFELRQLPGSTGIPLSSKELRPENLRLLLHFAGAYAD